MGIIITLLEILKYAIIANAILSFLPNLRHNQLVGILYQITEPILSPIRNLLERSAFGRNMMFDISPIIAILLIEVVERIVAGFFMGYMPFI